MKKLFISLFSLSLAGCSSLNERVPCPKTMILAEFSKSIDLYQKIPIRSELDSITPTCTQDDNQTIIDLRLRITSFRPLPSFYTSMKVKPSYFVAVVDNTGEMISRSNHEIEVVFEEKQTTKVSFVRLEEKVPAGKSVAIYIGFNLDATQFDFLQKERVKKPHD